jgi:tRNA-splicing endonuclease subunit Sen2
MNNMNPAVSGARPPAAQKQQRPNYNALHAQPLPLKTYPLPPLIPHNPLSILYIALTYLRQFVHRPSSHPASPIIAYFSSETRSVHVTDPSAVRALWEHGFFGKGSLSRSEPTWLEREKRRLGLVVGETSEDITRRRREERKAFKQERARKQREEIEEKRKAELGQSDTSVFAAADRLEKGAPTVTHLPPQYPTVDESAKVAQAQSSPATRPAAAVVHPIKEGLDKAPQVADEIDIVNNEHLQLDLNEAFFLAYALGMLQIYSAASHEPVPQAALLQMFMAHATFPPLNLPLLSYDAQPDNKFLVHYAVYHHFRSLGWVVRPGIKFGVDLLLYNRGPVFTHAEFAIVVVPSYTHDYWKQGEGQAYVSSVQKPKAWHWLHMVSRVQSQVKKTLVLCFVEVPPPWADELMVDGQVSNVAAVLGRYKIREVILRRWVPNRTRD